jgi:hypothetical protein
MNHYDDDDDLEPRNKASVLQRIGSFFSLHEEEEFEEPEEPGVAPRRNVVQFSAPPKRGPARSASSHRADLRTSPRSPMPCARVRS